MNPKDKKWEVEETKWLSENYSKLGRKECARILNRTRLAISTKASKLGIEYRYKPKDGHKVCGECKIEKPFEFFNKSKKTKYGLNWNCKECLKNQRKNRKISEEERLKKKEYRKLHYLKNKEKKREYWKTYRIKNRDKINFRKRKRRLLNANTRIKDCLSARLRIALKEAGIKKSNKTLDFVGCSMEDFRKHIESQFEPEMSWDNYGELGWVLDHIAACECFNLTDPEEQKLCFFYKNIMPRWATTDIAKSHGSNQIGNSNKQHFFVDTSYYHLLQNPS